MLYNFTSWNKLFFVWPDINYFPASSQQEAESPWRDFEKIMSRVVSPAISLVGVLGNSTNIVILIRGKLTKSSTCLILALAVIDTLNLLSTNNIAIHLYARGRHFGFDYPEPQARALFYVYKSQQTIEMSSKVASMLVPCLITLDRLVAVLAPYRYTRIMTVRRVSIAIFALILLSSFFGFFAFSKYDFLYISVSPNEKDAENISNTFSGIIVKSDFYSAHEEQIDEMFQITSITYGPISLGVIVVGCLVVGIQVKIQARKRALLLAVSNEPLANITHTTRSKNTNFNTNKSQVNKSHVNKSHVNKSHVNKSHVNKSRVNKSHVNKSHVNKSHAKKTLANKTKDVLPNRFQERTFKTSKLCLKFVQCLECVSSSPMKTKHINTHDQLGHARDTQSASANIHVKKEKLSLRKHCQIISSLYQKKNISFDTCNRNINNTFFQAHVSGLIEDYYQNHDFRLKTDNSQALDSGLTRDYYQTNDSILTRDHSLSHNSGLVNDVCQTNDSGLTRDVSRKLDSGLTRDVSRKLDSGLTRDVSKTHDSGLTRDVSKTHDSGLTRDVSKTHDSGLTRDVSKTHDSGLTRNNIHSRVSRIRQNKTTKTLLSVCGVYSLANTLDYVMLSYLNHAIVNIDMAIGLETARKFVLVLNSACNFVFYVGMNRKFKESYKKLFGISFPSPCIRLRYNA